MKTSNRLNPTVYKSKREANPKMAQVCAWRRAAQPFYGGGSPPPRVARVNLCKKGGLPAVAAEVGK